VEWFATAPGLAALIVPHLNSYAENQDFLIQLCFIVGTLHLTIAHLIQALRYGLAPRALAELGWILILWFLYLLAGNLVLGYTFPVMGFYLLAGGVVLASAFGKTASNPFKAVLLGLADLPLNVIRSFSDVVSYLRLFAVGYATLVVAASFNDMAATLGWGNPVAILGATCILFFGHGLNILLGIMAVLVHGVRLNMLEFSGHLGLTWSGRRFAPFTIARGDLVTSTREPGPQASRR
jgi:V/A-type H+-transporting ATPase subunit I